MSRIEPACQHRSVRKGEKPLKFLEDLRRHSLLYDQGFITKHGLIKFDLGVLVDLGKSLKIAF